MSDDRELLELAAKAAYTYAFMDHGNGHYTLGLHTGMKDWNPLTDDGDALRLAVEVGLSIMFDRDSVQVSASGDGEFCAAFAMEAINSSESATRRAIVRAAAEIGRAMP